MLKIYHSPLSRSMRVVWLCEEIGLDYAIEKLAMFSPEMKRPEYLAIHPGGSAFSEPSSAVTMAREPPEETVMRALIAGIGAGALLASAPAPKSIEWTAAGSVPALSGHFGR